MPDLYGFSMKAIDGTDQRLGDYKGKVLLIVNVASQCGSRRSTRGCKSSTPSTRRRASPCSASPAIGILVGKDGVVPPM
jgi:glutathione peroxidase